MNNRLIVLALIALLPGWADAPIFGQETGPAGDAPKQLPAPPTVATPRKTASPARTRLKLVSKKGNAITDDAA